MLAVSIITPDRIVFEGEADSVTLPSSDGEITILPKHIPIISVVGHGTIMIRNAGNEEFFAVSKGVLEVSADNVRILADVADRADELEEEAIRKAKEKAEKLVSERRNDAEGFAEATAVLNRELARLHTVRRHRSRRIPGASSSSPADA